MFYRGNLIPSPKGSKNQVFSSTGFVGNEIKIWEPDTWASQGLDLEKTRFSELPKLATGLVNTWSDWVGGLSIREYQRMKRLKFTRRESLLFAAEIHIFLLNLILADSVSSAGWRTKENLKNHSDSPNVDSIATFPSLIRIEFRFTNLREFAGLTRKPLNDRK